jgi:hypothetical protein
MGVAEMLERLGSFEIAEWKAEFQLRDDQEREAIEEAKQPGQGPRTLGG